MQPLIGRGEEEHTCGATAGEQGKEAGSDQRGVGGPSDGAECVEIRSAVWPMVYVCMLREMCGSTGETIGCSGVFRGSRWWNEEDKNGRVCYPDILWRCRWS